MKIRRLLYALVLGLGLTLAAMAGLGGDLPYVRAATYTVITTNPGGSGSLRSAILHANANPGHDTIDFDVVGTIVLTDTLPAIADDLTIAGPGAWKLAISGANAYRVFAINSGVAVTITGLTVRDGSASHGGGILSAGDLYLSAVQILENSASPYGGGVYIDEGNATLIGMQVINNSASHYGGGIYVDEGSATLNGTQVISNSVAAGGGGVYVASGHATLIETQVISNASGVSGGGVYASSGNVTLVETQVTSNSAAVGGGMYASGSSARLNMSGGEVISNAASFFGGGVYLLAGGATFSGTQVIRNSAVYSGGAAYVNQSNATLNVNGGTIESNSADEGGGVYVVQGSATLDGVQVTGNLADNGGGMYVDQGSAMLIATQMTNNAATNGGGVFVDEGRATLNATQVTNNAATNGGGVSIRASSARLNVDGGEIVSNSAAFQGGGVYLLGGIATLTGTQVISNSAHNYGGGMYIYYSNAALNMNGGTISDNSADASGGGVFLAYGSATLRETQVNSNTGSSYGGGVYINQSTARLSASGGTINDNSASNGGGVYIEEGSAVLNGAQVFSNSATFEGGGMSILYGNATMSGTQIMSNSAHGYGGGMYIGMGNVTLSRTQVISNVSDAGGGVYVDQEYATLNVNEGAISNNSAGFGGGVCVRWGSMTLSGTQVIGNSASQKGGGVEVTEDSATLKASGGVVADNSANEGGGVYVGLGIATLSETQVLSNIANFGGGIHVDWGSATLSGTQVFSNSANDGGGVYVKQENATLNVNDGTIGSNSASLFGGGVYVAEGIATLNSTHVGSNLAAISGGGVYVDVGDVTLSDTRVLDNHSGNGGSLYQASGSITATNGCIVNNSDTSAVRAGGPTLRATGNWWGAVDGPSGAGPGSGDSVSAGVDYAGFLTAPLPGCPTLAPDLGILKTVTPTVAGPGQAITYTLAFHNTGTHLAGSVIITDTIPVSVTYSSLNVAGSVSITATGSTPYVWETVDLAPGAGGIITITGVLSDSLAAGSFGNTATIASAAIDADTADNSSSAWLALNQVPVADAGDDQSINTLAQVSLYGSASSDPDSNLPLTYGWTQTGGPNVSFNPALSVTTFTAPGDPDVLTFTLIVTDALSLPDPTPDEVVVTVNNQPPVADAGSNQSVEPNTLVTLDGSASSDPDGDYPLSYLWTQTGGPSATLNNPAGPGPAFIAPGEPAVLTFTLVVTDSLGLPDPTPDEVVVSVTDEPNTAPVADAGPDQSVALSATVTLDGSASSDPDGHLPLAYAWAQTGGPAVTFTHNLSVTTFTAPGDPAVLTFTLVVTDSLGMPDPTPDEVVATVTGPGYRIYLPLVVRQSASRVQAVRHPALQPLRRD